ARKQRFGKYLVIGSILALEGERPERTALVQRIQNHIPAPGVVVRLDELTSRVVDHRCLAPLTDLPQISMVDLRPSASDIHQNQHPLRLFPPLHSQLPNRFTSSSHHSRKPRETTLRLDAFDDQRQPIRPFRLSLIFGRFNQSCAPQPPSLFV